MKRAVRFVFACIVTAALCYASGRYLKDWQSSVAVGLLAVFGGWFIFDWALKKDGNESE